MGMTPLCLLITFSYSTGASCLYLTNDGTVRMMEARSPVPSVLKLGEALRYGFTERLCLLLADTGVEGCNVRKVGGRLD